MKLEKPSLSTHPEFQKFEICFAIFEFSKLDDISYLICFKCTNLTAPFGTLLPKMPMYNGLVGQLQDDPAPDSRRPAPPGEELRKRSMRCRRRGHRLGHRHAELTGQAGVRIDDRRAGAAGRRATQRTHFQNVFLMTTGVLRDGYSLKLAVSFPSGSCGVSHTAARHTLPSCRFAALLVMCAPTPNPLLTPAMCPPRIHRSPPRRCVAPRVAPRSCISVGRGEPRRCERPGGRQTRCRQADRHGRR